MSNIVNKIGETLGVGGGQKHPVDQHNKAAGGGIIDKVKNQIPGVSSATQTHQAGGYKEGGHAGGGGGIIDKVKNQIPGVSSATGTHQAGGYKEGGHAGGGGGIIDKVKNQIQGGHK